MKTPTQPNQPAHQPNQPTPFQRLDTPEQAALIETCERILAMILAQRIQAAQQRSAGASRQN